MVATVTLYRPTGSKELQLVAESGYRAWPPRLTWQPIFYPVLNEEYATQIAREWNAKDRSTGCRGFVARFKVRQECLARYEVHRVGGYVHEEYWIPADELDELNRNIVGPIEVIAEYVGGPDPAPRRVRWGQAPWVGPSGRSVIHRANVGVSAAAPVGLAGRPNSCYCRATRPLRRAQAHDARREHSYSTNETRDRGPCRLAARERAHALLGLRAPAASGRRHRGARYPHDRRPG